MRLGAQHVQRLAQLRRLTLVLGPLRLNVTQILRFHQLKRRKRDGKVRTTRRSMPKGCKHHPKHSTETCRDEPRGGYTGLVLQYKNQQFRSRIMQITTTFASHLLRLYGVCHTAGRNFVTCDQVHARSWLHDEECRVLWPDYGPPHLLWSWVTCSRELLYCLGDLELAQYDLPV